MVRVLSIPLFKRQNIQTIERSVTSCCTAPPNKLLIASSSSHCIEVTDLDSQASPELYQINGFDEDGINLDSNNFSFSFPTVDSVKQIVHSENGNYIATLETKSNRQNRFTNYVRIYANWDSVATLQQSKMTQSGLSLAHSECGMVQPMRARIAGRVTPSLTQSSEVSSLEMIEIPTKRSPDLINCCQITGNLLILSNRTLLIYKFIVKTHEISKQRFIDFEEIPVSFELSFVPCDITLTENYISAMNTENYYLFKINYVPNYQSSQKKESGHEPRPEARRSIFDYSADDNYVIDFEKELKNEMNSAKSAITTVILPSILRENNQLYKNLPFKSSPLSIYVTLKSTSPLETKLQNFQIENLLQLKISPCISIDGTVHPILEEFKNVNVKLLYTNEEYFDLYKNITSDKKYLTLDQNKSSNDKHHKNTEKVSKHSSKGSNFLKSSYYSNLKTVVCLICTSQEGYLYHFDVNEIIDPFVEIEVLNNKHLVSVYSFTSVILKTVTQNSILHALTETGLESYTLKTPDWASSTQNDPIYLIGLKSFMGVRKICLSESYLILLANYDSSPIHSESSSSSSNSNWTLYNLELPSTIVLHRDMLRVAKMHKKDSLQTYIHLLNQSHEVLRINLLLCRFKLLTENGVSLLVLAKENNTKESESTNIIDLIEGYVKAESTDCSPDECAMTIFNNESFSVIETVLKNSCCLLGDFHLTTKNYNEYKKASVFYEMAKLSPMDVLKRFQLIDYEFNNLEDIQGILHYLKTTMLQIKFGPEADQMFTPINDNSLSKCLLKFENVGLQSVKSPMDTASVSSKISTNSAEYNFSQTFADTLLEIFNRYDADQIPLFVIKNVVIKEYATDRIIKLLNQKETRSETDIFALCLLYLQKNDTEKANVLIEQISNEVLMNVLTENWELLFDKSTNVNSAKSKRHAQSFSELTTVLIMKKTEFLPVLFYNLVVVSCVISMNEVLRVFISFLPTHIGLVSATTATVLQLMIEKYLKDYVFKNGHKNCKISSFDLATEESLKILARTYLSKILLSTKLSKKRARNKKADAINPPELKTERGANTENEGMDLKMQNAQNESCDKPNSTSNESGNQNIEIVDNDFLFYEFRYKYLDMISPCSITIFVNYVQENMDVLLVLKKFEALICSNFLPQQILEQMTVLLTNHPNIIGELSLRSLIFPIERATILLLEKCPACIFQFAKDRYTSDDNWRNLIIILENKLHDLKSMPNAEKSQINELEKILKDVLTYLATNCSLDKLLQILPMNVETCKVQINMTDPLLTQMDDDDESEKPSLDSQLTTTTDLTEVFSDQPLNLTNSVSEPISLTDKSEEAIKTVQQYNDFSDVILKNDYLVENYDDLEKKMQEIDVDEIKQSTEDVEKEDITTTEVPVVDDNISNDDFKIRTNDYEPYIQLCKKTAHANQIRQFIVSTGQQLLATLNL